MQAMKLVILDRDGTINADSDEFIKSPEEWTPLPGALEAIARMNHAGWHTVIASNQSGLGRGLFDVASLNAMHAKMHKMLLSLGGRIDAVFYCPDLPGTGSACRKPRPGMLLAIGERFSTPLERVPAVGDKLSDLEAAGAVGARPILVLTGKGELTRAAGGLPAGTQTHPHLHSVAEALVQ
jgi:D-glycero-D-manno-heptose 1,7-bisphosphate phosphatase